MGLASISDIRSRSSPLDDPFNCESDCKQFWAEEAEVLVDVPVAYVYLFVISADPVRAESNDMLSLVDIQELLGLEVLGLIPESKAVLTATNVGQPVIMSEGESADLFSEDLLL